MDYSQIPLFNNFLDDEINQMIAIGAMREKEYSKGSIILHAESIVYDIGIVEMGSVNIENIDYWGNKSIISNISKGKVFAESYAFSNQPLMVDVVASEDCKIIFINIQLLLDKRNINYTWYIKFLLNMLGQATEKNIMLSNRIFCTSSKTIRSRLIAYLSNVSHHFGSNNFCIPFNRQELADYLNLDRSALSKELGKMRDEGILDFHKNNFILKNNIQ